MYRVLLLRVLVISVAIFCIVAAAQLDSLEEEDVIVQEIDDELAVLRHERRRRDREEKERSERGGGQKESRQEKEKPEREDAKEKKTKTEETTGSHEETPPRKSKRATSDKPQSKKLGLADKVSHLDDQLSIQFSKFEKAQEDAQKRLVKMFDQGQVSSPFGKLDSKLLFDAEMVTSIKSVFDRHAAELRGFAASAKKTKSRLESTSIAADDGARMKERQHNLTLVGQIEKSLEKLQSQAQEVDAVARTIRTVHPALARSTLAVLPGALASTEHRIKAYEAIVHELRGNSGSEVDGAMLPKEKRDERRRIQGLVKSEKKVTEDLVALQGELMTSLRREKGLTGSQLEQSLLLNHQMRQPQQDTRASVTLSLLGLSIHEITLLLLCICAPFQAGLALVRLAEVAKKAFSSSKKGRKLGNSKERPASWEVLRKNRFLGFFLKVLFSTALTAMVLFVTLFDVQLPLLGSVTQGSVSFVVQTLLTASQTAMVLGLMMGMTVLQCIL